MSGGTASRPQGKTLEESVDSAPPAGARIRVVRRASRFALLPHRTSPHISRQNASPGGTGLAISSAETAHQRRSYAFLVERLLPRERLSPARASQLQTALVLGDPTQLYEESLAALRELESLGLVTQNPLPPSGHLVFQVRNGDRIHLMDPGALQQSSRPGSISRGRLADPRMAPQARPSQVLSHSAAHGARSPSQEPPGPRIAPDNSAEELPAAEAQAGSLDASTQLIDSLQPLLPLAGLQAELVSLPLHLQHIIETVESQWRGARVRLFCIDESSTETLTGFGIHTISRQAIEAVPHHAEAVRKGDVSMATSAPPGVAMTEAPVAAAVPLNVNGAVWGLLEVTWPSIGDRSMQQQVLLLRSIGRLIELAIQNQNTMENLVFIDPLTGVFTRGFYERQVALEIERAHRTNRKFGLLVLDVDDFKRINDQYGHPAGDQVLRQVGQELQNKMRKIDLLFRYGGEEFVVLLPGAEEKETERTGDPARDPPHQLVVQQGEDAGTADDELLVLARSAALL